MTSVLFLCTGNSARSILAEVLLNVLGGGRFQAFSAGSQPVGQVNPLALKVLAGHGLPVEGASSKSWDDFGDGGTDPEIEIIITVCDSAASETCPIWPGHPVVAHWGLPDPAAVVGSNKAQEAAFERAYQVLKVRVEALLGLDLGGVEGETLCARLSEIGGLEPNSV